MIISTLSNGWYVFGNVMLRHMQWFEAA
ncbi:isocitrate dehydrogenase, partial [Salmonella enterica subsp. enterica serovar Newport]|nr:isocitrate dehydrogenase [Salmonella enterica subsp. enterica serovar Falkensee]EAA9486152.1 isocitrate dehydrogenase [Salmonella enterica]EBE4921379.1 isocitrate dehydrogenase [Salmonella enterica subsp. enterica serovar Meleagridis]EBQ2254154.1 isocitrate dehydrogenase [Salmonella enterica subsp. enterica]EBR8603575.1 isocitrate dehydrogenase [Salmonella enterica subsp. enterica serovar Virchow]EBS3744552.1 isocitrate dehydrogenase [Salmonella enterica subsp. enterica serovar Saintpaul]E